MFTTNTLKYAYLPLRAVRSTEKFNLTNSYRSGAYFGEYDVGCDWIARGQPDYRSCWVLVSTIRFKLLLQPNAFSTEIAIYFSTTSIKTVQCIMFFPPFYFLFYDDNPGIDKINMHYACTVEFVYIFHDLTTVSFIRDSYI